MPERTTQILIAEQGRVCPLCTLMLQDGDKVWACTGNNTRSWEREFVLKLVKGDPREAVKEIPSDQKAVPLPSADIAYHRACHRLIRENMGTAWYLEAILKHDFCNDWVIWYHTKQRPAILKAAIVPALEAEFRPAQGKLPYEIWFRIAGYLMSEFIVAQVLNVTDRTIGTTVEFDVTRDVYATFVKVLGNVYIKRIRNLKSNEKPEAREYRILAAQSAHPARIMYVGRDHLGIRKVQFAVPGRTLPGPNSVPGVWWQRWNLVRENMFQCMPDSGKLRNMMICRAFNKKIGPRPNDKIARSEMLFPVRDTQPLTFVSEMDLAAIPLRMQRLRPFSLEDWRPDSLRNVIAVCDPEVKGHTFMHRVGLNEPGTIGYSVAVTKYGIQKILVHREEYTFPEYRYWIRDEPEWCCWVYMPMNVGEHITQICASPSHMLNKDKSTGLTFITNRNRARYFSRWATPDPTWADAGILRDNNNETYLYDCLYKPNATGDSMYYGVGRQPKDRSIVVHLAFKGSDLRLEKCNYRYPLTPTTIPLDDQNAWFFSCCSLKDVVKITLCVSRESADEEQRLRREKGFWLLPPSSNDRSSPQAAAAPPPGAVLGMLLEYANGDKESVGSFRFDWATSVPPMEVVDAPGQALYIGYTRDQAAWVRQVRLGPPSEDERFLLRWKKVPWDGMLEWWVSGVGMEVRHVDKESGQGGTHQG